MSAFTVGLAGLRANARTVTFFLQQGLNLALVPLAYLLLRHLAVALARRRAPEPACGWTALWLAPPLLFYLLAHIGDYGYTFSVLPGLLVLAARGVVLAARDLVALAGTLIARPRGAGGQPAGPVARLAAVALALGLGAGIAVADARIFLAPQGQFSVAGIDCFNQTMRERLNIVRQDFRPAETLIFTAGY